MAISSLTPTQLCRFVDINVTRPLLLAREDILNGRRVVVEPSRGSDLAPELELISAYATRGLADGLKAEIGAGAVTARPLALPPLVDELAASRARPEATHRHALLVDWNPSDVLITGASSGLGRATAKMLAERGARVFAIARRKACLDSLERETGGRVIGITADVSDPEQVANALATWRVRHGGASLSAVIHAAGGGHIGMLKNASSGEIRSDISTNVLGALLVARETLPFIAPGGRLAIVTSGAAFIPWTGGVVYVTGKSATYGLARALMDYEAKDRSVTVTAVTAGAFDSELWTTPQGGKALRLAMGLTRIALPSAETASAEMLNDIENGVPVSFPGIGGALLTRPWAAKIVSRSTRHLPNRFVM